MKIYTKKGDAGETSLIGGTRVSKAHIRIGAYGTIDELNCFVGLLSSHDVVEPYRTLLKEIQDNLFTLGSLLASDPEKSSMKLPEIEPADVDRLELSMDEMNEILPDLRSFVLPGGHPANSLAHVCRTVCRRAERAAVRLNHETEVPELILKYINRLSDWFFVLARMVSYRAGTEEVKWEPRNA